MVWAEGEIGRDRGQQVVAGVLYIDTGQNGGLGVERQ